MLELPHVVVGATIAAKIGDPVLALPLALASHFALDLLPHWNPHLNTEMAEHGKVTTRSKLLIVTDVILSLGVGIFIASQFLPDRTRFTFVILGSLMGVLPDLVEAPHFFMGVRFAPIEKLLKFQKSIQNDVSPVVGILSQVVTLGACWWWLK